MSWAARRHYRKAAELARQRQGERLSAISERMAIGDAMDHFVTGLWCVHAGKFIAARAEFNLARVSS